MAIRRDRNSKDIDSALTGGRVPPSLEILKEWAQELRATGTVQISDEIATAHISSIATIAANGPYPGSQQARLPILNRLRQRLVLGSLLSSVAAKVFAATVALATVTGGVAAAGALPDALQNPIATIYNSIGFDFPTSDDEGCETSTPEDCTTTPGAETPKTDPDDGDETGDPDDEVRTGPNNTNGNKSGPANTNGNKTEPGDNNGKGPGNNNGNGPGDNPGNGPGDNPGNGPGDNPGNGPGDNPGNGPGDNKGKDPKGQNRGDEG